MFSRLADTIVAHRWTVLLLVAVVTVGAVLLSRQLRFDFTIEALFYGEQEEREFNEEFNDTFAHEDHVVVVILKSTGPDDVLTARAIEWQVAATQQLAQVPNVTRTVSLSTIHVPRVFGLGRVTMYPVIRTDRQIDDEAAESVREKVAVTPLLDGMLVSKDRQCAAVVSYLDADVDEVSEVGEVVDDIDAVLATLPAPDGYELHLTGLPWIRRDISQRLRGDQSRIVPACAALFLTILVLMYRRWSGLLIPWLSILVAVTWTTAVLVLLDVPLNIVTNVLPAMLMVVGVSNCVHVVSYFSEQSLLTPGDPIGTAKRTLYHMSMACLLTCTTTAIGFLSLLAADAQVLSGFGWQSAIGMAFIFIATMLISGSLMPMLAAPKFTPSHSHGASGDHDREDSFLARVAAAMGTFAVRQPLFVVSSAIWIMVGAIVLGQNVLIDSRLIDTYDRDDEVVKTIALAEEKLGGFMPLELSLTTDDPDAFQDPDVFFRVARASSYLEKLPDVSLVRSYVDLYRQLDRTLPGKERFQSDEPTEAVTDGSETVRRLNEVHEHLSNPRNAKDSRFRDYMAAGDTHARISVHVRDIGIRRIKMMCDDIEVRMAEIFPPNTGVHIRLTGDSYYSSRALRKLISDLFYSLIGAGVVIFFVIALLFRSVRLAIAAILPNVTPLIVTLGYMGMMAWSGFDRYVLNPGNVIVFAISLGIAVDDTIHFLARFRDEAKQGGTIEDIVRRTCLGTGRAIVMTSLLIVTGLSVIYTSEFIPTRRFAELTSVTMCAALFGDLLLLPACLKLVWRDKRASAQPALRVVSPEPPTRAAV